MKCKHCGEEIPNDSVYCEFCGAKQKRSTRLWLVVLIVLGVAMSSLGILYLLGLSNNGLGENYSLGEYVDLGLPSGTKWKTENEEGGFCTYKDAKKTFGGKLPTEKQYKELKDKCQWSWTGSGMRITGPNGNSIVLPADGYRHCDGSVNAVGCFGTYWSSTPNGSEYARELLFGPYGVDVNSGSRCSGRSVRLVQD